MSSEESPDKAKKRAEVILQVRAGTITATEGAQRLGVSRKTYYEWERRGLGALLEALEDQPPGRPPKPDNPVETDLRKQLLNLEEEVEDLQMILKLRQALTELAEEETTKQEQQRKSKAGRKHQKKQPKKRQRKQ